jgi:hypothetical protein
MRRPPGGRVFRRPAKTALVGAVLVLLLAVAEARADARAVAVASDTFPHDRHKKFACLTCHFATGGHGRLTFQPPRGCQICHHQAPAQADCSVCHQPGDRDSSIAIQVTISVPKETPRARTVGFPHVKHTDLACIGCHTTPATLEPADSVLSCRACHSDHHASGRSCATCHKTDAITAAHEPPAFQHKACDACHTLSRVSILIPTRSFCLVCHEQAQDHHGPKECTGCHFLRSPEEFRPLLTRSEAQ